MKSDGVTLDALGAEHDAQRKAEAFEHGALFDVQLQVSRGVLSFTGCLAETIDLYAAAAQRFFQANTVLVGAFAIGLDRVCSRKGGGSEQAPAEARAFFVGPVDQTYRDRRAAGPGSGRFPVPGAQLIRRAGRAVLLRPRSGHHNAGGPDVATGGGHRAAGGLGGVGRGQDIAAAGRGIATDPEERAGGRAGS